MLLFGNFVLLFTSPLLFLIVLLVTAVWRPVNGEPRVIGSLQPIVAAVGDDVILPCHVEPAVNVQGLTVEWSLPDLKPDPSDRLSRVEYVHVYRDRREILDMKIQSYFSRTELFGDGLRRGNISLKITNVTLADGGRYKCLIPKLNSQVKDSVVTLVVEPKRVETLTTETPFDPSNLQTSAPDVETDVKDGRSHLATLFPALVFCVLLFLVSVGGVGGYLLKYKCQKQDINYDAAPGKPPPA